MISIQDAVRNSVAFAKDAFAESDLAPWSSIRLEEVEKSRHEGQDVWLITLSIPLTHAENAPSVSPILPFEKERRYKVFTVDRETGEVISMRIREFAGAHE